MKTLSLKAFALLVLFCVGSMAYAQTVTGVVSDAQGTLPGVNIWVKGTDVGTQSDIDGKYSLNVSSQNAILVFSYLGFVTQEIPVKGQSSIDVFLVENTSQLDEVVVIGYGTARKSDATGAMEVLDINKIDKGASSSPEQMLNGRIAGVQMAPNGGQPGATQNVRIRGVNSISASSEPLYVIDGVPIDNNRNELSVGGDAAVNSSKLNPLSMIAPNDIESISVLKDASATAIYGSRGANGVIIIKTKSGKGGKGTITYDAYVSLSSVANKIDLLSADEYRNYVSSAGTASTDWQDEIFRTAISHNHTVAFSGNSGNLKYRASIGRLEQEGIVLGTDLKTTNARLNAAQTFFDDKLSVRFNLSNTNYKSNNIIEQQTGGASGGVLNNALKMDPTEAVYNDDGTYNEYATDVRNPVALAEQVDDVTEGNRFIGGAEAEYKILPELSAKVNLAYDMDKQNRKIYQPIASSIGGDVSGRAIRQNAEYSSSLLETYLTYNKTFEDKHNLNALAGYSWQKFISDLTSITATGFDNDNLGYDNISAQNQNAYTLKEENRLISFFGRVNYSFDDKYLLTATLRADGSSKFGGNNQWGYFPSAAFAWKVINEDFMNDNELFSNLKLRLGYGITGNQNIGNFRYLATVNVESTGGAYFGDSYYLPYLYSSIPNEDLKWEQTSQFNAGLDFGILENKLTGSIDFYNKKTTDLLLEIPAVQPAVSSAYLDNIGSMKNTGLEVNLDYKAIQKDDFTWNLNFNFAYSKNEITELYNNSDIYTGTISGAGAAGQIQILREGESIGSFYGFQFEGFDSSGAEVFKDQNGDGTIDDNDKVILGCALPDFTFGLSSNITYKNWDFGMLWRAQTGNDIFNNTRAELEQPNRLPGQNTNITGAENRNNDAYTYLSDRWIEDASFIKLDNLTVGYKLNTDNIKFINFIRLYITAQNLLTITDYSGYDPEVNTDAGTSNANAFGVDYTSYPQSRTFMFGASIRF